jgi:hypothetical protein
VYDFDGNDGENGEDNSGGTLTAIGLSPMKCEKLEKIKEELHNCFKNVGLIL